VRDDVDYSKDVVFVLIDRRKHGGQEKFQKWIDRRQLLFPNEIDAIRRRRRSFECDNGDE